MSLSTFQLWNRCFGWNIFFIALTTFGLTVEPTASFWDAGEYVATFRQASSGSSTGAPLFQMMGAFFALFFHFTREHCSNGQLHVCFSSAFTVLFLYWTLTLLMKKIPVFQSLNNINERFYLLEVLRLGH